MRRKIKTIIIAVAIAIVALLPIYLSVIRPWQLTWGATREEIERVMPGDDLVNYPTFNATRAVTIETTRENVWPWLVQMGYGRAGWYSYDLIDNLGRRSAERVIPELQELEPGDLVPMGPGGFGLRVKAMKPDKYMVWGDDGHTTWTWGLYPTAEGHTRLISRVRIRYRWAHPSIFFNLLIDVGDIVMMRKCMLGIKRRAEEMAADKRK